MSSRRRPQNCPRRAHSARRAGIISLRFDSVLRTNFRMIILRFNHLLTHGPDMNRPQYQIRHLLHKSISGRHFRMGRFGRLLLDPDAIDSTVAGIVHRFRSDSKQKRLRHCDEAFGWVILIQPGPIRTKIRSGLPHSELFQVAQVCIMGGMGISPPPSPRFLRL